MKRKFFSHLWHQIRTIFLSGLFTLLPFTLTVALFIFSFRVINAWLAPVYQWEPAVLRAIPGSQIIFILVVIFGFGVLIRLLFLEPLIHFLERIFFKIPLMKQVYGGFKQLVKAFSAQSELAFKKVVIVPFPTSVSYSIGFLTSEIPQQILPFAHEKFFYVFIPTTPNPTSGFLIQIAEKDIIVIDLTRQEAMSLIISGGIIQPDRFRHM